MKEYLEHLADENGWGYKYAPKSYMNLNTKTNPISDGINLMVEPFTTSSKFDLMGNEITTTYQGKMMMLVKSDYDDTGYESRYTNYIQPIISEGISILKNSWGCDHTIDQFSTVEVIKLFDRNMDGVLINYVVTEDV